MFVLCYLRCEGSQFARIKKYIIDSSVGLSFSMLKILVFCFEQTAVC